MHIYNKVVSKYQPRIMSIFPEELIKVFKQNGTRRFCSFSIGFKPYSLVDNSGAKINIINGDNQKKHYISDPELKYMKKQANGTFSIISITEKIDDIFNSICQKINDVIGSYIGLRFFLRRTLAVWILVEIKNCSSLNWNQNLDSIHLSQKVYNYFLYFDE